jgi:hypothetical protein
LKYDAKDIEIIDLTMYQWNKKNQTKGKKKQETNLQKWRKEKSSGNNHDNQTHALVIFNNNMYG